jgi:hypothetical protein
MHHTNLFTASVLFVFGADDSPDIRSVAADLRVPDVESGPAAAGKRVKEAIPGYAKTNVYHVTYLPTDWQTTEQTREEASLFEAPVFAIPTMNGFSGPAKRATNCVAGWKVF